MYLTKQGGKTDYNYSEIVLDNASELSSISTTQMSPGSIAYVTSNGAVYMLNSLKQWIEQTGDSGTEINNQNKTVTENGIYVADAGYTGLGTVTVNVQPKTETKSVTITENGVTTVSKSDEKDGMTSVEVTVAVPQPSGSISITENGTYDVTNKVTAEVSVPGLDLSAGVKFGSSTFETLPSAIAGANWNTVTDCQGMFKSSNLTSFPLVDTSNVTTMTSMFQMCFGLTTIPQLNTGNVQYMQYTFQWCPITTVPLLDTHSCQTMTDMFGNCTNIDDTGLDNILQMCANVDDGYFSNKTLSDIGIKTSTYSSEKIQSLPHYQDFLDAGWTIS